MRAATWGECRSLARSLPCVVCVSPEEFEEQLGCAEVLSDDDAPVSDPAHVRSRGASKAAEADHANVIPLCRVHHIQQHAKGWAWMAERYGLDAVEVAARVAAEVLRRGGGRKADDPMAGPVDQWEGDDA